MLDYPDLAPLRQAMLEDGLIPTPQRVFDQVVAVRTSKLPDPSRLPNAGSFFKNPLVSAREHRRLIQRFPTMVAYPQADGQFKLAAGWLIDQCGWKGRRLGPVGVHDRQALVLVNFGQACADELLALAQQISDDVSQMFGVTLEIEPICWA
jgi:UDP-N-acetylmuramate dehydrogenase